jgi:hypothetical protein
MISKINHELAIENGETMLSQEIRQLYTGRPDIFRAVLKTPPPGQLVRGQIWSTKGFLQLPNGQRFETEEPRIVVIIDEISSTERLEQFRAVLLSVDVSMASEFDLIVPASESSLKFDFMIEVWNEIPVLGTHLKHCLGTLSPEYNELLHTLYKSHMLGERVLAFEGQVGPPLMGEADIRFTFQEVEIRAAEYLAQAAGAAASYAETITSATPAITTAQQVLIPNVQPSWKSLLKRLQQIGIPREFVQSRLASPELMRDARHPLSQTEEHALVSQVTELVQRIFRLDSKTLFSTTPLSLEAAYGVPRFKKSKNVNEPQATAYTFYAHYLSLLVLQATPHLIPQPLPNRSKELYDEVTHEFGSLSFENVLRYAWTKGVVILPLNDPGKFHGACWREDYRNVIVLKQRSDYEAFWLFNLLHELKHAADHPSNPSLQVIDLEPDKESLLQKEERAANLFAGNVMLGGRAELLAELCVESADKKTENLKRSVQHIARSQNVRTDALANYLAYRLAMEDDKDPWWPTAATLQVKNAGLFTITQAALLQQIDFGLLNEADRSLLRRAVNLKE